MQEGSTIFRPKKTCRLVTDFCEEATLWRKAAQSVVRRRLVGWCTSFVPNDILYNRVG